MSRSSHHKLKYQIKSEVSLVHCNEGTSARTRPFSFEDIMLRRKSKKAGELHGALGDSETRDFNIETSLDVSETDADRNCQSFGGGSRSPTEDLGRFSSKSRELNLHGVEQGKLEKQKDKSREEQNLKTKSNTTLTKDLSRKDTPRGKANRDVQNRKRSDRTDEDFRDKSGQKRFRDRSRNEISGGKTHGKSVNERVDKQGIDGDNKRIYSRGRDIDQSRHEYENEPNKKKASDRTDKYADTGRRVLDEDSRRKHQVEGKEKTRNSHVSEHDMHKSSEVLERKETGPSINHHEESRRKRRSGSREHNKDRSRRSSSLSPRTRKRMSLSDKSYSSKDKYQKQHFDTERRISSNGSDGNQRRYCGSSSGLGGYSPRKRKTEAAAKTPSPANRSPEHRTAGWDHPATRKEGGINSSSASDVQSASQAAKGYGANLASMILDTSVVVKPGLNLQYTPSSQINAIDSIQLTQATRPLRRLYVENLPSTASEKTVLECVNNFLLSSGVNHIKGTLPCISCMINKEKNQALLEFLTPEDASAALSMDGKLFCGSLLKIRRPKDFIEPTTAVHANTVNETHSISDKVEDTSHKIFIGGISKLISSKMLMKIAESFGSLKAFHFVHNEGIDVHYAFLEYVDHLITQKACAGLNGLKLGGQVLTVVQATPDIPSLEDVDRRPFYGIPEHAKPLLKSPTPVLKLKNMILKGSQ
ncbi:OLC1v1019627C1 [Oldenlandia corymbosa var. corymbosa]|uniref:OLC1v1019627C1 n=1 Tax=Oldenlandia corymbosa var. corymbosa TaxID=529605 RepID=A0AAV1EEI3_OLDCO|nr:OLC1v1019627C1 [Oldenlandia corymbosa var. corymbosa]